jgi:hypothetical protein
MTLVTPWRLKRCDYYRPGLVDRIALERRSAVHAGHIDEDAAVAFGWASNDYNDHYEKGGEVARLRRFVGRLAAPALAKGDIVINAYDAGVTRDGHGVVAFEALQSRDEGEVAVIKHGWAELSPT